VLSEVVHSGREPDAVGDFCFDEIAATRQAIDAGAKAVELIERQEVWSVGAGGPSGR
jgi:hypothetical protein